MNLDEVLWGDGKRRIATVIVGTLVAVTIFYAARSAVENAMRGGKDASPTTPTSTDYIAAAKTRVEATFEAVTDVATPASRAANDPVCQISMTSLEIEPMLYGSTWAQDSKRRMGNAMTACPGFKEAFDAAVAKSADQWLDSLRNLPDGARQAIRPATIVWLEATDSLAQAKASADMEQTLLLWLNLNRPRPVAVIPAPDNSLQQFDLDQMKQKLRDLQNCIEFGTIC